MAALLWLFLSLTLTLQPLKAMDETCPLEVKAAGNIQVQRMRYGPEKQCMLMVTLLKRPEKWRSYSYFTSGLFMIFSHFGGGSEETSTGAKTYYFFPRLQEPQFFFENERLRVVDSSGREHHYDLFTGDFLALQGATIEVSSQITKSNQGGFAIKKFNGLRLENGFALGELPYAHELRSSLFVGRGFDCSFENSELFNYSYKNGRLVSATFRYTDLQVKRLLDSSCLNPSF